MPVSRDILATYRGPAKVMRRLLAEGRREDRALAMLMGGCLLAFVSQWPPLARQAHLEGQELNGLLAGALFGWLFVAPLMMYAIGAFSHIICRLLGGRGDFYAARLALFWSFLAASPILLLNGLSRGFLGEGPPLWIVGFVWVAVFLWFWIASLIEAERGPRP